MRIGIDARELCGKPTGVGRHLAGILSAWAIDPVAAKHTFVLYAPQTIPLPLPYAELRVLDGGAGTPWEQITLPRAAKPDRLDAFLAPAYTAPLLLGTPTVVIVHDISFVAHPEWFRRKEGLRRRLLTRWSCRRAARVLTDSEASRRDIVAHFAIAPDRVDVVNPGVLAMPAGGDIARESLVLSVGSIFNRRHVPDLIRAFTPIAKRHPAARLEIVGDNRTYPYQDLNAVVATEGTQSQVSVRAYVPDEQLPKLYARARAFALLSEYEGFGLPPLEALSCGVPPVLLDTPVAREICGPAALYVPNTERPVVAAALETLLFDEDARRRVLQAAPEVLGRYSWTRAASQTLAALERAR